MLMLYFIDIDREDSFNLSGRVNLLKDILLLIQSKF